MSLNHLAQCYLEQVISSHYRRWGQKWPPCAKRLLKDVWVSAHARNHVICKRYPKCPIAVVLADVDLPYWTSKVEHIAAVTAIFSNICTAHPQKRIFVNFRCKFWHRHSIRRPRFPVSAKFRQFGDVFRWFFNFCILYAECPPYFYFRFVWPTDLESIPHASTRTSIIPTKFEDPTPIRY